MSFKKFYSKDPESELKIDAVYHEEKCMNKDHDVFITYVEPDKLNKATLSKDYFQNKSRYNKSGNIRIFKLEEKKKYMCFDTDDKKSNDHVSSIMKKYGIKDNCYPSISNYFEHDIGDNSYKHHYWFVTDKPITSHIHVNNTLLDVWGPNGRDTNHSWLKKVNYRDYNIDSDNDSNRIIFEPNVEGLYLDTNKTYPILTDEIYNDLMNININKGIFSNKKQVPSCIFHNDCIAFEQNLKSKMNNNKDKDVVIENKNKKSIPIFKNIFEKTDNKKYYYELKYKNYDNTTMYLYNRSYSLDRIAPLEFLNAIEVWAKIVNVYDGDTFYAIFEMPQEPIRKYKIRLTNNNTSNVNNVNKSYYINAAEVDSKNHNEKMKACQCKKIVEDMILNKIVRLKIYGSDHHGRILANVYINDDDTFLSEYMIQNKYYEKVNFNSYNVKKISEPSELLQHIKKNIEFKRDGYSAMSSYHKKKIQDYLKKNPNLDPLVFDDYAYGLICCVNTSNDNDPLIASITSISMDGGSLSLPKGHSEDSESDIEAAIRETREEIGIDASKYIHPSLYITSKYTTASPMRDAMWKMQKDYPDESKRPICVYYKEVKFFLAVFPEILELKPQPEEILECKWIPLSTFKKETYPEFRKTITEFFNSKNIKSKLNTTHVSDSTSTNASLKNKKILPTFLEKVFKKKNQDATESKLPPESKPQFNKDSFHFFHKQKTSEPLKKPLQLENQNDEPTPKKQIFSLFKKK